MAAPTPGEFELIARLAAHVPRPDAGVIGIGDDAAGVPTDRGYLLLTCDIVVEGRHFLADLHPMRDVGWRVASANVSDVAACGGTPTHALVSLGVPPDWGGEALDELYEGLGEAAQDYGFQVLGGNVTGARELLVDLFMLGETSRFVARAGAQPGDLIALSGSVGRSAAGLDALRQRARDDAAQALVAHHLRPRARTDLAPLLVDAATAAIDISDGLASELHHLAQASGVHLAVDAGRLPRPEPLEQYARKRGQDPLQWILHGGEEYELLFTLRPDRAEVLEGRDVAVIGEVRAGSGVTLSGTPLAPQGWDHLRREE